MLRLYLITLTSTGDEAEASDLDGALLAARTLCEDAARGYGQARLHCARLIITREDQYDGLATSLAQAGQR